MTAPMMITIIDVDIILTVVTPTVTITIVMTVITTKGMTATAVTVTHQDTEVITVPTIIKPDDQAPPYPASISMAETRAPSSP